MEKTCSRGHVFQKSSAFPVCPFCLPGRYRKSSLQKFYDFQGEIWIYPSDKAAWHFVTVPNVVSAMIKNIHGSSAKGWGSIPVEAKIGKSVWKTSVFPDRKREAYILPIKLSIRKIEGIASGNRVTVRIAVSTKI